MLFRSDKSEGASRSNSNSKSGGEGNLIDDGWVREIIFKTIYEIEKVRKKEMNSEGERTRR